MGIEHGAWCVGCCWALMVLLFAVGVMSITWMVVVSAIVFAEKVLPIGEELARVVAVRAGRVRDLGGGGTRQRARFDPPGREPKMHSMLRPSQDRSVTGAAHHPS